MAEIAVVNACTRVSGCPTANAYVFFPVRQNSMTGLQVNKSETTELSAIGQTTFLLADGGAVSKEAMPRSRWR